MNKLAFVMAIVFASFSALAQNDPKALGILDAMSKKYKEMASFKARFSYTLENTAAKTKESSGGDIIVKGPKFHLKMANQEIYNNGTTVWTYIKESNDVNITNNDPEEDELNPSKIYNLYKQGYKYRYLEDKIINGVTYEVVELNPEDTRKKFFKIKIEIKKTDHSLHSWQIFEKNGNRYSWSVTEFTPNFKVEDTYFNFDKNKYPGVNVEDLR
ncbi:MAG: outer membrane lipoprotein carrier protein LolA [Cytophagaceae bacterium]|jgi:outer membrane lipoprotein-sorting protein|nr:outer membrane lipoprotein carrier protein LolA [Cytophagaceae bacterium]